MTRSTEPAVRVATTTTQPLLRRAMAGLGAAGLIISLVMLYVHHQLVVSGGGYASFCNVSEEVNCDAVLGSRYAYFLGVPVAAWTAATYLAFIALPFMPGRFPAFAAAALGGVGVGYSMVLAAVSLAILKTVCLMCAALYVVNIVFVVLAWLNLSRFARGRMAAAAVIGPLLLATATGYGVTRSIPASVGLGEVEIARREPEFYRWYVAQPVIPWTSDGSSSLFHTLGPADATVTIVEFSDFTCSHCAKASRALKLILARHPDDVRVIFRHFPLDSSCNPTVPKKLHPTACEAATAAECAGQQGRFWEYHDYLFEHQEPLDYASVAEDLGLEVDRFRECLSRGAAAEAVARDVRRGTELGVKSTPTTYFNGREIRGALLAPLYEHAVMIEKERAAANDTASR